MKTTGVRPVAFARSICCVSWSVSVAESVMPPTLGGDVPGIQDVPANGTRAIADASIVSATTTDHAVSQESKAGLAGDLAITGDGGAPPAALDLCGAGGSRAEPSRPVLLADLRGQLALGRPRRRRATPASAASDRGRGSWGPAAVGGTARHVRLCAAAAQPRAGRAASVLTCRSAGSGAILRASGPLGSAWPWRCRHGGRCTQTGQRGR